MDTYVQRFVSTDKEAVLLKAMGYTGDDIGKILSTVHLCVSEDFNNELNAAIDDEKSLAGLAGRWVLKPFLIDELETCYYCGSGRKLTPTDEEMQQFREGFAPHYPDKLYAGFVDVRNTQTGEGFRAGVTYAAQTKVFAALDGYREWYETHADKITPGFKALSAQYAPWLANRYGIVPDEKAFVAWFIGTKIGALGIEMQVTFDEVTGKLIRARCGEAEIKSPMQNFTPAVMHESLQEYCLLEQGKLEEGHSHVSTSQDKKALLQNSIPTEAKTPTPKAKKPTVRQFAFQFLYLVEAGVKTFPDKGKIKMLLNRGIELGYKSGDDFKNAYYAIESGKLCSGDIPDLEAAILLLDKYPAAKQLAEDQLKILKSKTV